MCVCIGGKDAAIGAGTWHFLALAAIAAAATTLSNVSILYSDASTTNHATRRDIRITMMSHDLKLQLTLVRMSVKLSNSCALSENALYFLFFFFLNFSIIIDLT